MSVPLIKKFSYNAPIEKVWRALTGEDEMRKWYFPQLQKFEPKIGFKFQFDQNGAEYQKEWIVTKLEEGRMLAHSWAYKGFAGNSEVIFELLSDRNNTGLKVTQTDLESFPDDAHFARERFEWGWENLLGQNLKRLLENGENF